MSQSAARRPPQPFHVLLAASPGDSVAPQPPPPALPVSPSIRDFRGPHVPLQRALTCRPAGEKSHCSEVALRFSWRPEVSRPPTCQFSLPHLQPQSPAHIARTGCPWGLPSPLPSITSALSLTWAFSLTPRWAEVCRLELERTQKDHRKWECTASFPFTPCPSTLSLTGGPTCPLFPSNL